MAPCRQELRLVVNVIWLGFLALTGISEFKEHNKKYSLTYFESDYYDHRLVINCKLEKKFRPSIFIMATIFYYYVWNDVFPTYIHFLFRTTDIRNKQLKLILRYAI